MDILIPGYQLRKAIGKGGMATVFLAKQSGLERNVALKVMSKELAEAPSFGERFMREAKIVSQLVHPNIVTVHEVGQHKGKYYLSMEYLDGGDLRSVRKTLDFAGKIRVIEDIARALHYAGEKGYVHRDIKPENIMFRSVDNSAVLTDFGIAKAVETDLSVTQTGTAIGTPHYMSPEQAKGKPVDHRSDLYSLGVLFFYLLTGRVPYDADTAVSIGIKHISEPLPILPSCYQDLQGVIDGLLAKGVSDRYQSGLALLNDLRQIDLNAVESLEQEDEETSSDDAPTVISAAEDHDERANDSQRFTIEYQIEPAPEQNTSIRPLVASSVFVALMLAFLVYLARPSFLEPYILALESGFMSLGDNIEREAEVVNTQVSDLLDDLHLNDASSAEDASVSGPASAPTPAPKASAEPEPQQEDKSPADAGGTHEDLASQQVEGLNPTQQTLTELEGLQLAQEGSDTDVEALKPDIVPLSQLEAELAILHNRVAKDPAYLIEYVAKHYALLDNYPDHQPTQKALAALLSSSQARIFERAEQGDSEGFDALCLRHREVFAPQSPSAYGEMRERGLAILKRKQLLQHAEVLINKKQILNADNARAVDLLKEVLRSEPNNQQALEMLASLSKAYTKVGATQFANSEIDLAELSLATALKAQANNLEAKALVEQIRSIKAQREKLARHLVQAATYIEHGFLYAPAGASAYDEYGAALNIDIENLEAKTGLTALIDKLSERVWALIGDAKFDQANTLLERPSTLLPDNPRIQAMRAALEEVQEQTP